MNRPPATLTAAEMAATPHDLTVAHDGGRAVVRATGAAYEWSADAWRLAYHVEADGPAFTSRGTSMTLNLPAPVPHVTGPVACRICARRWISVVPAERGLVDLECPDCGAMAGDAVDEEGLLP